jgi:hypothetical protein
MADAEIIALLDHIKDIGGRTEKKLDEHIDHYEKTNKEFLLPLWNAHQQRIGSRALLVILCSIVSVGVTAAIDWVHK